MSESDSLRGEVEKLRALLAESGGANRVVHARPWCAGGGPVSTDGVVRCSVCGVAIVAHRDVEHGGPLAPPDAATDAYRRGAEAMRDVVVEVLDKERDEWFGGGDAAALCYRLATSIRALPIPEDKR